MRLLSTVIIALPMLMGGFVQFVISQFYQKFATDTLFLDSAVIGSIFFVSRVTDAVLDPVCGYFSDKYRRRRIFIGLGILAMGTGMVVSFLPALLPIASRLPAYLMAATGIFVIYLGVTLVYIPHYAWISEKQAEAETQPFFASRAVTENFGTILGAVALLALVGKSDAKVLIGSIAGMTLILALIGAIPLGTYGESVIRTGSHGHSFTRSLQTLAKDRRFALVAAMSFCNQFAATTLLGVSLYYTNYVMGDEKLAVTLAIVFLLSATLFVPLWAYLGRKFNRYALWQLALVAIILVFPTLLVTQAGFGWYLPVFALLVGGFAGAVILFVPQEVSDLTAHSQGESGLYFAAFTFVNKSAMACSPLVIGFALSLAGYNPAVRTATGADTITLLFIGVPALAFMLSAALLRLYMRPSALNAVPTS